MTVESAFTFECAGESLVGILHCPTVPATKGILMIVGGPQYRVGSHRQFVEFARTQCEHGCAVMRFDYRGMGDSSGALLDFEQVGPDTRAAMEEFCRRVPSLQQVYWFGLCDAASAALMYNRDDPRPSGLILLNPWVRTEHSEAQAILRHYYWKRILSRDFWRKLMSGRFTLRPALQDLLAKLRTSRSDDASGPVDFRQRMLAGASDRALPVLLILSGEDLTANEFEDHVQSSPEWQSVTKNTHWTWHKIAGANHTFASSAWKAEVSDSVTQWMKAL